MTSRACLSPRMSVLRQRTGQPGARSILAVTFPTQSAHTSPRAKALCGLDKPHSHADPYAVQGAISEASSNSITLNGALSVASAPNPRSVTLDSATSISIRAR